MPLLDERGQPFDKSAWKPAQLSQHGGVVGEYVGQQLIILTATRKVWKSGDWHVVSMWPSRMLLGKSPNEK